jgi:hypothetical protein
MLAPNWVVNIGNSISLAWNNGIKDYPDPVRDNQQVLINGIQFFHLMGRWTPYSYVMDTRYLNNGFIDNYQTYAVGVAFKLTQKRSIRFSVLYDNGNNFDSLKATLGASWKF